MRAIRKNNIPDQLKKAWIASELTLLAMILLTALTLPSYGQSFDTLLNELSGSDPDEVESERKDSRKKEDYPSPPEIPPPWQRMNLHLKKILLPTE